MELLLLVVLISGFIINILLTKYWFKQLLNKIQEQSHQSREIPSSTYVAPLPIKSSTYSPFMKGATTGTYQDRPVKNDVMEQDLNDIEFSEQSFATLPKDLKLEVEGGDTTPPGFEEDRK